MTEATAPATTAPTSAPVAADTALTAPPASAPIVAPAADAAPANTDGTVPDGEAKPATPEPRAPAEYSDFTVPEGKNLPPELADQFKTFAKDMDLTQEQAQKLVELGLKRDQTMADRVNAESTKWLNELPSDKEFGGEKLSENLAVAKKAMDAFGTPELKQLLETSRLGNHPEMIRAFYRAGLAISQDSKLVTGGSGDKPAGGNPAKSLYPNQS
jgi:hypothetical protein